MPLGFETRASILAAASPYFTQQVAAVFLEVVDRVPIESSSTFWVMSQEANAPQLRLFQLGPAAVQVISMTSKSIDVETVPFLSINRSVLTMTGTGVRLSLFGGEPEKALVDVRGPLVNGALFNAIRGFGERVSVALTERQS